jgi:hypothetical protein
LLWPFTLWYRLVPYSRHVTAVKHGVFLLTADGLREGQSH